MRRTFLVALIAGLALVTAGAAGAAPPTLLTAGQSGGRPYATWSLPSGGVTWSVEVATSSATGSDGYFSAQNVVAADVFMSTVTSWSSDVVLDPGVYYVHVAAQDTSCTTCPLPEWSAVQTFTVSGTSSSTGTNTDTSAGSTPVTGSGAVTGSSAVTGTIAGSGVTAGTGPTSVAQPAAATAADRTTTYVPARYPEVPALWLSRQGRTVRGYVWTCIDRTGKQQVSFVVRRGKAQLKATRTVPAGALGCQAHFLKVQAPAKASGRVTVTVRVRDAAGTWSLPATKRLS